MALQRFMAPRALSAGLAPPPGMAPFVPGNSPGPPACPVPAGQALLCRCRQARLRLSPTAPGPPGGRACDGARA